jgi:Coenzyme PQQ synthesis protein D (PqqD)
LWNCCNGTTTLDDMVHELAEAYRADGPALHTIGEDVRLTVRKLAELGLVAEASSSSLPTR